MTTVPERASSVPSELHKGNTSPLGATVCHGGVNFSVFARDCRFYGANKSELEGTTLFNGSFDHKKWYLNTLLWGLF
jgi:hypothetical protein